MERQEILNYIRDLRDLEYSKELIVRKSLIEEKYYKNAISKIKKPKYLATIDEATVKRNYRSIESKNKVAVGFLIVSFLIFLLPFLMLFFVTLLQGDTLGVKEIVGYLVLAGWWPVIGIAFYKGSYKKNPNSIIKDAEEERIRVNKANRAEEERWNKDKITRQNLCNRYSERLVFWKNEYDKICSILDKEYSLNIIPAPRRNLPALIYIYNYMSTSSVTLEHTLLSVQIEEGIQSIENKLEYIIDQNAEMIINQRRQELLAEKQHNRINSVLADIRDSSRNTEQYARLSAYHSAANTFFLAADWIERH